MKQKNKMSKLRLAFFIFFILGIIFISSGFNSGDESVISIGMFFIFATIIIRVIRFLYRD